MSLQYVLLCKDWRTTLLFQRQCRCENRRRTITCVGLEKRDTLVRILAQAVQEKIHLVNLCAAWARFALRIRRQSRKVGERVVLQRQYRCKNNR